MSLKQFSLSFVCVFSISSIAEATITMSDGSEHTVEYLTESMMVTNNSSVSLLNGYVEAPPAGTVFGNSAITVNDSEITILGGYYKGSDEVDSNWGGHANKFFNAFFTIKGGSFVGGNSLNVVNGRGISSYGGSGLIEGGEFNGGVVSPTAQFGGQAANFNGLTNGTTHVTITGGQFTATGDPQHRATAASVNSGRYDIKGGSFVGAWNSALYVGSHTETHIYGGQFSVQEGINSISMSTPDARLYIYGKNITMTPDTARRAVISGILQDGSEFNWGVYSYDGFEGHVFIIDKYTDLKIEQTSTNVATAPNAELSVQLLLSNVGAEVAPDTRMELTLPETLGWNPATSSSGCELTLQNDERNIVCPIGALEPANSASIGLSLTSVDQQLTSGNLVVKVVATTGELNQQDNAVNVAYDFSPESDLAVRLVGTNGKWNKETGEIRYQISVENQGDMAVTNVSLQNLLPAEVTLASMDQNGACNYVTNQITCSVGNIDAGEIWVANVVVTTSNSNKMLFTAGVTTDTRDLVPANNNVEKKFGGSLGFAFLSFVMFALLRARGSVL